MALVLLLTFRMGKSLIHLLGAICFYCTERIMNGHLCDRCYDAFLNSLIHKPKQHRIESLNLLSLLTFSKEKSFEEKMIYSLKKSSNSFLISKLIHQNLTTLKTWCQHKPLLFIPKKPFQNYHCNYLLKKELEKNGFLTLEKELLNKKISSIFLPPQKKLNQQLRKLK